MKQRTQQEAGGPAPPPDTDRKLELNWAQLIGLPALALIPVLALLGFFGEHWETSAADGAHVHARVEYPDRFRARLTKPITVTIENRSRSPYDSVEVSFDSAYVGRFRAVNIMPSPTEAYVVSITDVKPGETKRVHMELDADQVGRHSGRVVVRARGDSAVIPIRTTVFP